MSRPLANRLPSTTTLPNLRLRTGRRSVSENEPGPSRRASVGIIGGAPKAQRTSKTSQKLVLLPSGPQTKALDGDPDDDLTHGYETDTGVREHKSAGERMSKEQRGRAGYKRITAYCIAETFRMKLLASFLKREHNVQPRVFDEALYVMYHLPLLPGYGPNTNVRSSTVPATVSGRKSFLSRLSEAEENGYQGTYFTSPTPRSPTAERDGYITSSSPVNTRNDRPPATPASETTVELDDTAATSDLPTPSSEPMPTPDMEPEPTVHWETPRIPPRPWVDEQVAEVVFFEYGVVVFFGLDEGQEKSILEDIDNAGAVKRKIQEDDWEVEECHFAHDPHIAYPRIYNDFFTLKSPSHLLKLSIAHALAQSTLLAHYETNTQRVLSAPLTLSIPAQLAEAGSLKLRRHDALKLTGRLFMLRRDVNLVSNVLDVPELFWSEASLKSLYDAVREYMEIDGRVQALNEKLGVASDFLDAIHDHLNNSAMERITWIVIWLIVVAILVELGEVIARLIVHATMSSESAASVRTALPTLSRDEALRTLERMIVQS